MRIIASKVTGNRKICVRSVDVFRFERIVLEELEYAG